MIEKRATSGHTEEELKDTFNALVQDILKGRGNYQEASIEGPGGTLAHAWKEATYQRIELLLALLHDWQNHYY